jgi:hypothetical protein
MRLLRASLVGLMSSACVGGPQEAEVAERGVVARGESSDVSLAGALEGAALFARAGCDGCHALDEADTGPPLRKFWGSEVRAVDGRTIRVEGDVGVALIVESMRAPNDFLLIGYPPLMPRYEPGELSDREVAAIVAALRCLADPVPADCAGVVEAFGRRS